MKKTLFAVLGISAALTLAGVASLAPNAKVARAEDDLVRADSIDSSDFNESDITSYESGYFTHNSKAMTSYAEYGATFINSDDCIGLSQQKDSPTYGYEYKYQITTKKSYANLRKAEFVLKEETTLPEGAEIVCLYRDYGYTYSYEASTTNDSTLFTIGVGDDLDFEIPDGIDARYISIQVTGTDETVYFESITLTWEYVPELFIQNTPTFYLNLEDGPSDLPILTTSETEITYSISYGDYILSYNTETEKFIPLGFGSCYVTATSGSGDTYSFEVAVKEDYEKLVIESNDTVEPVEGWEIVEDPSTLTYGDVITLYSQEVGKGMQHFESDDFGGHYTMSDSHSYDGDYHKIIEDDFDKFMLVPSSMPGTFEIIRLDNKTQKLCIQTWQEDLGSLHYETKYSISLGEVLNIPSAAWGTSIGAKNFCFATIESETADKTVVVDGNYSYSPQYAPYSIGLDEDGYLDAPTGLKPMTVLRYAGELHESYEISDEMSNTSTSLSFAHFFLEKMGEVCLTGRDAVSERFELIFTTTDYSSPYAKYMFVSGISKYILVNCEADEYGDTLQRFASLYDFLVNEYGFTDYVGRNPVKEARRTDLALTNYAAIASIIIGFSAICAVGTILFVKKGKKETF